MFTQKFQDACCQHEIRSTTHSCKSRTTRKQTHALAGRMRSVHILTRCVYFEMPRKTHVAVCCFFSWFCKLSSYGNLFYVQDFFTYNFYFEKKNNVLKARSGKDNMVDSASLAQYAPKPVFRTIGS